MDPTKDTAPENAKLEGAPADSVDEKAEENKPVDAAASADSPSEQQQSAPTDGENAAGPPSAADSDATSGDGTGDKNWLPDDPADDDQLDEIEISNTKELNEDQVSALLEGREVSLPSDSEALEPVSEAEEPESPVSETKEPESAEAPDNKAPSAEIPTPATEGSEKKPAEEIPDSQTEAKETSPTSEEPDAVKSEDDQTPPDPQAVLAALEEQRSLVVKALFADERPAPSKATQVVNAYAEALNAAANADVLEDNAQAQLVAKVSERHATALAAEKTASEEGVATTESEIEFYEALFSELDQLVNVAAQEMESRQDDGEPYQSAPEGLQSRLSNYKKGIEIIHRMFNKVKDRKKDLSKETPESLKVEFEPAKAPDELEGAQMWLGELLNEFHSIRDVNYHAVQDAKKLSDKCRSASRNAVKSMLSAIDGIDSGLQNEPTTLEALAEFQEEHQALIDDWFGAYDRLSKSVEQFLDKTGVEARTVERGIPFDPETMEPLGMVEVDLENDPDFNPKMEGEFVVSVLRRGFSLDGELIRPVQVDVVKIG
jgi:molecular chaperone GrpE (heat shock protein)